MKSRRSTSVGCSEHRAGRVVRIERPGPMPDSPRALIRRSTVQRATRGTGASPDPAPEPDAAADPGAGDWAFSSLHVFRAPRASLSGWEARSAVMRPSTIASQTALALGARLRAA